jgi:DNA-binding response OmpR family regulator
MGANGVILLVDDDVRLNNSNRRALEFRRFTVHTATSFTEANRLLFELNPDIIMMEAILPDGDGFDFCTRIYGTTTASIIFLTAKTSADDVVRGIKTGGDEYIEKPCYRDIMIARVENVMRHRKRMAAV